MASTTLWASAAVAVLVAGLYAYIAYRLYPRPVEGPAKLAHWGFLAWWIGLAISSVTTGINISLYQLDLLPLLWFQLAGQVSLFAIVVALWGLLYYLAFLYTGSDKLLEPLTIGYGIFYLAILGLVVSLPSPEVVVDNGWNLETLPESDLHPAVDIGFLVFLVGPQILACVAYLRLYTRVDNPTQKYRIALVSTSIILWFGTSLVGSLANELTEADLDASLAWQLGTRALSILAATAILLAYLPPRFVQEKYGIRALETK